MKTCWNELVSRPWLLVVLAFAILIGAWTSIILISLRHPAVRLNAAQEQALLQNHRPEVRP